MKDGIYRLTVSNKSGCYDYFRGAIAQDELTAWNSDFTITGVLNHLNSEIYIMKSSRGFLPGSIIDKHVNYSFTGKTSLHESGFTINDPDNLEIVVIGYKDDASHL